MGRKHGRKHGRKPGRMRTPCPACLTWRLCARIQAWYSAPAHVPGGGIPDQQPNTYARLLQPRAGPRQELFGDGAHRMAIHQAQPDALLLPDLAGEQPITRQGFGIRIGLGRRLLHQAQRSLRWVRPGVRPRPSEAAPPGLIRKPQRPVRLLARHSDQAVTPPFFST